jgi:hypothetical protein
MAKGDAALILLKFGDAEFHGCCSQRKMKSPNPRAVTPSEVASAPDALSQRNGRKEEQVKKLGRSACNLI